MSVSVISIDVRDDIRAGRDPFSRIMEKVSQLREGEGLKVIAPFEPRPLINLLTMQGFTSAPVRLDDGTWEVTFETAAAPGSEAW